MNHLIVFIILLSCFCFHAVGQEPEPETEPADPPLPATHPFKLSLGLVLGMILGLLILTLVLIAYLRFCHLLLLENTISNPNFNAPQGPQPSISRSRTCGMDRTTIESIPFFVFSSLKGSKEGLECAVCLSKFEDSDVLRLLPKCKHAFHMDCVDRWLEIHSTCPLCRYKLNQRDLETFTLSNSFRLSQNLSNLSEDPNIELFIQREDDQVQRSSSRLSIGRFSIGNSPDGSMRRKQEIIIQEGERPILEWEEDGKLLHKFNHKIIVSDVVLKRRWSDLSPSDLLSLNSDMLSFFSSKRFNLLEQSAGRRRCSICSSTNIQIEKLREDLEAESGFKSKFSTVDSSNPSSSFTNALFNGSNSDSSKVVSQTEKRSVSEITMFSRFRQFSVKSQISPEKMRNLWLPMVQKTGRRFFRQERCLQETENNRQRLNI